MSSQTDHNQWSDLTLKLQVMSNDLLVYNHDKEELKDLYIKERLQKSTNSYLNSIKDSLDYLKSKRSKYLLRKIKKL